VQGIKCLLITTKKFPQLGRPGTPCPPKSDPVEPKRFGGGKVRFLRVRRHRHAELVKIGLTFQIDALRRTFDNTGSKSQSNRNDANNDKKLHQRKCAGATFSHDLLFPSALANEPLRLRWIDTAAGPTRPQPK